MAISSIANGSLNPDDMGGNGNYNGDNDPFGVEYDGNGNGNGLVGSVGIQGGGICNIDVAISLGSTSLTIRPVRRHQRQRQRQ